MKRQSILIAHYRPDVVSGAERAIADMVASLESNLEITMLTPGPGPLADFYNKCGFQVWSEPVSTPRRLFPGLHRLQSLHMADRMRSAGIDAVICNTFAAASRLGTASRMAGIPYAIYAREYISDKQLYRQILQKANLILAVSADVASHFRPLAGDTPVVVAYDNILIDPIRKRMADCERDGGRRLPFDNNEPVAGWVGRITPYKQPELFLRAIPYIIDQVPRARFILVGEAKPKEKILEDRLRELALELGISDRLSFLGRRKDVPELMREMSVLCLTSSREPFARVILEAQVVGCPVVAPLSGGVPEVIQDEVNGLMFDSVVPEAPELLASRVVRLMENHQLAIRLAQRASETVTDSYGSNRPVRDFEAILTNLVQKGVPLAL